MSEVKSVEATNVTATSAVDSTKSIIITKSIKSLTEPTTPAANGNQENLTGEAAAIDASKALTPEEKLQLRIKKFGIQSENAKLNVRAQRFGVSASGGSVVDESKLGKRAERFGIAANAPATPVASSDALEIRSKRFGISADNKTATAAAAAESSDPLILKRKERFGVVEEDDKKKLRSQRFESKV